MMGMLGQLLAKTEAWTRHLHDVATEHEDEHMLRDVRLLHETVAQACKEYMRMGGLGSAQFERQVQRELRCIDRNHI